MSSISYQQCSIFVRPHPLVISKKNHICTELWISAHAIPWDPNFTPLSSGHPNSSHPSVLPGQLTSHFLNMVILEHPKPHRSHPSLISHSPQVYTTNFNMWNCSSLYYLYRFHPVNFMKTRDFLSYKMGVDYHDTYLIGLLRSFNK